MKIKEIVEELKKFDEETEVTVLINLKEYTIKLVDGNDQDGVYFDLEDY